MPAGTETAQKCWEDPKQQWRPLGAMVGRDSFVAFLGQFKEQPRRGVQSSEAVSGLHGSAFIISRALSGLARLMEAIVLRCCSLG